MTFSTTPLDVLRRLSRVFGLLVVTAGLTACQEEEYRGVLVAKFVDGSARFIKRIAISSIDGPTLSLPLVSKTKRCELVAPVPVGALSGITDCKEISGVAVLRCDGDIERQTRWQMTSCHSGFGRSIEGTEPAFLFGFSGNSYSAQNQLELAMQTKFEKPVNACPAGIEPNSPDGCNAGSTSLLPWLLRLPVESNLP